MVRRTVSIDDDICSHAFILVIAISTAMLRNQITALNWLGIGVALLVALLCEYVNDNCLFYPSGTLGQWATGTFG